MHSLISAVNCKLRCTERSRSVNFFRNATINFAQPTGLPVGVYKNSFALGLQIRANWEKQYLSETDWFLQKTDGLTRRFFLCVMSHNQLFYQPAVCKKK